MLIPRSNNVSSEHREPGLFIPLMVGGVLLLAVGLLLFVLPIVPDPRPRKPMDGVTYRTTVWDKWTFERNARRASH